MIINGNYVRVDYEKMKPNLIEAFTEYYGEEHRETVEERINSIHYIPYHSFDFVNEYYKKYITLLRDQILDNFFEVTKVKRTVAREELLLPEEATSLDESPLLTYLDPVLLYQTEGLTKETFVKLEEYRLKICSAFGIPKTGTDSEIDAKATKIRDILMGAIRKAERDNPCDIFEDMARIDANEDKAYKDYIKFAEKHGFNPTPHDRQLIENSKHLRLDKSKLDCNGLLFNGDINNPGLIQSYTSIANKIILKGKNDDRNRLFLIIYERLKYMRSLGVDFKVLDPDDFNLLSPTIEVSEETMVDLLKEYNFQIQAGNIPMINANVADILEVKRKGFCEKLYDNCKFDENLTPTKPMGFNHSSEDPDLSFFMLPDNSRNKVSRFNRFLYFNEDEFFTPDTFLSVLLHETNHAVSSSIMVENYRRGEERCGLEVQGVDLMGDDIIGKTDCDPKIRAIMENVNERQAQELTKIYLHKFGNDLPKGDDLVPQIPFSSLYSYSNFLTQEFYSLFKDQIKEFNINPDYDIYFPKKLTDSPIGKIKNHVKSKFDNKFNPSSYFSTGILDYEKVRRLGGLVCDWEANYVRNDAVGQDVTPDDLVQGTNISELAPEVLNKVFKLRKFKDVIIGSMIKDLETSAPYRQMSELQELMASIDLASLNDEALSNLSDELGIDIEIKREGDDKKQIRKNLDKTAKEREI